MARIRSRPQIIAKRNQRLTASLRNIQYSKKKSVDYKHTTVGTIASILWSCCCCCFFWKTPIRQVRVSQNTRRGPHAWSQPSPHLAVEAQNDWKILRKTPSVTPESTDHTAAGGGDPDRDGQGSTACHQPFQTSVFHACTGWSTPVIRDDGPAGELGSLRRSDKIALSTVVAGARHADSRAPLSYGPPGATDGT